MGTYSRRQDGDEDVLGFLAAAFDPISQEDIRRVYFDADRDVDFASDLLSSMVVDESPPARALRGKGSIRSAPMHFGETAVFARPGGQRSPEATARKSDATSAIWGSGYKEAGIGPGNSGPRGESRRQGEHGATTPSRASGASPPPKEADADFLFTMFGQDMDYSSIVDILEFFGGDIDKSLDVLISITSDSCSQPPASEPPPREATSGLGACASWEPESDPEAAQASSDADHQLAALLNAFPSEDPARVVAVFQETGGYTQAEELLCSKQEVSGKALSNVSMQFAANLKKLQSLYPLVDVASLQAILHASGDSFSQATAVLLEAGVQPVSKRARDGHGTSTTGPPPLPSSPYPQSPLPVSRFLTSPTRQPPPDGKQARPSPHSPAWRAPVPRPVRESPVARDGYSDIIPTPKDAANAARGPSQQQQQQQQAHTDSGAAFMQQRELAFEEKRARDYYFCQARDAYERGENARAANLVDKGRVFGSRFKDAQKKAGDSSSGQINRVVSNNVTIDLHTLTVDEALEKLEKHIRLVTSIEVIGTLIVITGQGKHSVGRQAKIKPAVLRFLADRGISWRQINAGCICLHLDSVGRSKSQEPPAHTLSSYL